MEISQFDRFGPGVSSIELHKWQAQKSRFDFLQSLGVLNRKRQPRPNVVTKFYDGETFADLLKSERNFYNNPLSLIRPSSIQSLSSFLLENSKSSEPSTLEFGGLEEEYTELVKRFESFASGVLETVNVRRLSERKIPVKELLNEAFFPKGRERLTVISPVENPVSWITYTALSILIDNSQEITPIGRIRALALLRLSPEEVLSKEFRSSRNAFNNGFDTSHIARVPDKLLSEKERKESDHRFLWGANKSIHRMLESKPSGSIDWEKTLERIKNSSPEFYIQFLLLMLHSDASGVLKTSPVKLAKLAFSKMRKMYLWPTNDLEKIFGQNATFLTETYLPEVKTDFPTSPIFDVFSDQSIKMFREINEQIREQADTILAQKAEIEKLSRQLPLQISGTYYDLLRLNPERFKTLTEDEKQDALKGLLKSLSVYHPDRSLTGNAELMTRINQAIQTLSDRSLRDRYNRKIGLC